VARSVPPETPQLSDTVAVGYDWLAIGAHDKEGRRFGSVRGLEIPANAQLLSSVAEGPGGRAAPPPMRPWGHCVEGSSGATMTRSTHRALVVSAGVVVDLFTLL
jgi:hypothetical protein